VLCQNKRGRVFTQPLDLLLNFGSPTWARTRDLRINSPALYRLSYRGKKAELYAHSADGGPGGLSTVLCDSLFIKAKAQSGILAQLNVAVFEAQLVVDQSAEVEDLIV
jgi:hypothetical protein